jgi:hypothetical protein
MAITSGYHAQTSVTRPANTNTYAANDVVGATAAAWKFHNIGPAGGRILITSTALRFDLTAIPTGMTSFRLQLYNATPPSALADEATWDLPAGDRASYVGYIDLGSPADVGSTLYVQADQVNKQIQLAAGCSDLWGYLVCNGTYAGASSGVQAIDLHSVAL